MPTERENLESVRAVFAKYLQKQPLFERHMYEQSRNMEHILDCLRTYYYFLSYIADSRVLHGSHRGVLNLAVKTAHDVNAIHACLKTGCPIQARSLLRSLWETAVQVRFIYADFDIRIERYYGYKDYCKYLEMKKGNPAIPQTEYSYLEKRYTELKHSYNPKMDWYGPLLQEVINCDKVKFKNSRPDMRLMAELTGMDTDYPTMFHLMSFAVHGSSVIDHLFMQNNSFQIAIYDRQLCKPTVGMTTNFAHDIYSQILSHIENDRGKELLDYSLMLTHETMKTCSL